MGSGVAYGIGGWNEERPECTGRSAIVPLVILMLFASLGHNLSTPSEPVGPLEIGAQNNPFPLVIRGFAYLWALGTVLGHSSARLQFVHNQGAFLLFAAYMASSMLWSMFPIKVLINCGHFIGLGLVLMAAGQYFNCYPNRFFAVISGTLGAALLISIGVVWLIPTVGVSALDGRWQGLTGNSNSLGMIGLISVWSNTAGLYLPVSRKVRNWHWFGLAISFAAVAGSRSVTSILASGFAIAAILFLVRLEGQPQVARFVSVSMAAWGLLTCASMLLLFAPELLEAKGALSLLGRNTTLSGRTKLWEEAWKLIDARPILGWSFDSNMSVVKHLGKVGQFHSGYLDLLVRGGWAGMTLFICFLLSLFRRLAKLARAEYRRAAIFAGMTLVILFHNITEASLARETHLLWTLFLSFYFFANQRPRNLSEVTPQAYGGSNLLPANE